MQRSNEHEEWRDIPEHEGRYQASNLGRIRSVDREVIRSDGFRQSIRGRVLRQAAQKKGHLYVNLGRRGGRAYVHRLVAATFIGPIDGLMVRHLNDHPSDNRVQNLALGGASENNHDAVRNGRHAMANRTHCPRGHQYTVENTYTIPGSGSRACRACAQQSSREAYEKVRDPDAVPMADRTECPYGHKYTAQNTYIIPKTGSRTCRTCARRRQREWHLKRMPKAAA